MNVLPHLYRTVQRGLSPGLKTPIFLSNFSFTTTATSNICLFEANIPPQQQQQQHNGQQLQQKQKYYERPTPIVFVSGEGLSLKIWQNSMSYFSCRGYSGAAISLDYSLPEANIDSHIATLHQHVEASHFTPPFMIAHSLSCFIAQKYLESWPLSGLMMINPISHDPKQDIELLMIQWNKQQQQSVQQSQSQKQRSDVCAYYYYQPNNESLTEDMISKSNNNNNSPSALISDKLYQELISGHKDVKVNLESGVVPMSIVYTDKDKHHLTHEKLQSLCTFHNIATADVFHLEGCKHRLPMLWNNDGVEETQVLGGESRVLSDEKASFSLNDIMYNWIESLP